MIIKITLSIVLNRNFETIIHFILNNFINWFKISQIQILDSVV